MGHSSSPESSRDSMNQSLPTCFSGPIALYLSSCSLSFHKTTLSFKDGISRPRLNHFHLCLDEDVQDFSKKLDFARAGLRCAPVSRIEVTGTGTQELALRQMVCHHLSDCVHLLISCLNNRITSTPPHSLDIDFLCDFRGLT